MNRGKRRNVRKRLVGLIGSLLLSGLVLAGGTTATAADRRVVWQKLDQFVAIEKQDGSVTTPTTPNDHPAQLTAEMIRATLGPLRVTFRESAEPQPLFTDGELEILGETVRQGLSQVSPDEDVTFALIGLHPALFGMFKQPMVTAGRLFVSKGKLNLILGMVHDPVNERDDRRLKPFTPGSRAMTSGNTFRVMTKSGEMAGTGSGRQDWLTLSPAASPSPDTRTEEGSARPAPAVSPPAAPPAPSPAARPAEKGVEERLLLLKGLYDKGLITEEEYRAKKMEILREL
jgi:putative oligomerization/nucleic acid binding protein